MKGGRSAAAGGAPVSHPTYCTRTPRSSQPRETVLNVAQSYLIAFLIILTCVLFLPDGAGEAASAMKNNNNNQENLKRQKLS